MTNQRAIKAIEGNSVAFYESLLLRWFFTISPLIYFHHVFISY